MVTLYKEKKLLKKLKKISKEYSYGKIPISQVENGFSNFYLKLLFENKFASREFTQQDDEGNPIYDSVKITEKGQHYQEFKIEEFKIFLYRSILTPIVVSIITTAIVLVIKSIVWPLILKLL